MTGTSNINPDMCSHYAGFMAHLDRRHFDALYWTLFFSVLFSLFMTSWIYQRTLRLRDKPRVSPAAFRKKLKAALVLCTAIFLVTAAFCVVEVYALLALQFCDGEDLMSLFWSTWTMLQLGSEIAILGVALALWHTIVEIQHPMWALALGTPVLVLAGFGHVVQHFCERCWKRAKHRRNDRRSYRERNLSRGSGAGKDDEEGCVSSAATIKPEQEQVEGPPVVGTPGALESQAVYYFAIDVGGDERIRAWPSFMGTSPDGKAVLQLIRAPQECHKLEPKRPLKPGSSE